MFLTNTYRTDIVTTWITIKQCPLGATDGYREIKPPGVTMGQAVTA